MLIENQNIEIVILDNASTDQTNSVLNSINDPRLRYIRNDYEIPGPKNIIKSLTLARGEYAFLCLDKDFIRSNKINDLILTLKSHQNISFGYSSLNLSTPEKCIIYQEGFHSLCYMSYLSEHPSGMFYRVSDFNRIKLINEIFINKNLFGFYPDILNAEFSQFGNSLIINLPLFYSETIEDCAKIQSFTFKKKSDLFFFPDKRLETLLMYSNHACAIHYISKSQKHLLYRILFKREMLNATIGFRNIMLDENICKHYFVKSRKIRLLEIILIYFKFNINYLIQSSNLPLFVKIKTVILVNSNICFRFLNKYLYSNARK